MSLVFITILHNKLQHTKIVHAYYLFLWDSLDSINANKKNIFINI